MNLSKRITFSFLFLFTLISSAQVWNSPESISPIQIGEKLPEGQLINSKGTAVSVGELTTNKPTVLVVYRGGWCPYCNRQLAELSDVVSTITNKGAQLIAFSPEDYLNIEDSVEKHDLTYELYSDPKAEFIQKLGLAFYVTDQSKNYIAKKSKGEVSEILPVPAVIIVDTSSKVRYIYYDANYKQRLDSKELLLELEKVLN